FAWQLESKTLPVIVFAGDFSQAAADARSAAVGALHLGSEWYAIVPAGKGHKLAADKLDLKAVWHGGHEPLLAAVNYVLSARNPIVRVTAGVQWKDVQTVGAYQGTAGQPAWTVSSDGPEVYLPATGGDKLLTFTDGKLEVIDQPAKSKLVTRIDIDADGQGDWIVSDGKTISVAGKTLRKLADAPDGLLEMAPIDWRGTAALLLTAETIQILTADGQIAPALAGQVKGITASRIGDVDGDGAADLLLLTAEKLYVALREKDGTFGKLTEAAETYGIAFNQIRLADFDADKDLDVLLSGPVDYGLTILANDGKGAFSDVLTEGGEIGYHGAGSIAVSQLCDINHDGLVDIILVPAAAGPKVFFNRGFRTFGYAREMDLGATEIEGASAISSAAAQAALAVDLTGDDAQDLLIAAAGKLHLLARDSQGPKLGVLVSLAPRAAGPVTVHVPDTDRQLSSRVVTADKPVLIGKTTRGPLELNWQGPAGAGSKKLMVFRPLQYGIQPTE
ncbi:MAG: FG-GAP repeat domain-containing protein, partial [Planctomycetota bacterium]